LTELRGLAHDPRFSKRQISRRGELAIPIAGAPDDVLVADLQLIDIPAGEFFSGHTEAQIAEHPEDHWLVPGRRISLPEFAISRFPITNRQFEVYRREVNLQREPVPEELADHPVTWITCGRARMYCRWLARKTGLPFRLPTALEWEKAARGTDGRRFPWGDEFDPARASYRRRRTVQVWQFPPAGGSPYGVADAVGNAREWTSTVEGGFGHIVVCGGGMLAAEESSLWCTNQVKVVDKPRASIGFRVALHRP
jgi:formylglycine-generating enzyme required for sulfatase activity